LPSLAHSRALALALALVLALVLTVLSIVAIVVAIAATLGASVRASDNCTTTSATPITISSTTSKSAMSRRLPQPLPQPSQVSTAVIAGEIAVLAGVSCPMDQRGHRAWFALSPSLNGSRFAALPSKINATRQALTPFALCGTQVLLLVCTYFPANAFFKTNRRVIVVVP
jgi:hypothetical protein